MILDLFQRRRKNYFAAEWSLRKISPSVKILRRPFMELTLHTPVPFPHCHCCLCCTILKNLKRAFFFSRDLAFKPLALNGLCQYHHSKWIYQPILFWKYAFLHLLMMMKVVVVRENRNWNWICRKLFTFISPRPLFSLLFNWNWICPKHFSFQCILAHHTKNVE